MNLYKDGKYVETFTQPRELDLLNSFLAAHAEPRNPPLPEPKENEAVTSSAPLEDTTTQQANFHADVNPNGVVLSLDEKIRRIQVEMIHFVTLSVYTRVFQSAISRRHRKAEEEHPAGLASGLNPRRAPFNPATR